MKIAFLLAMVSCVISLYAMAEDTPAKEATVHQFSVKDIQGKDQSLEQYQGKVLLIVNVASKCGFTKQYEQLEAVYRKYKDQGLVVLGFPSNDFGQQEPGTEAEILEFCQSKYDVTFPLFSKIVVKGEGQHPLYQYLASAQTNPKGPGSIGWNFTKFLIGKDGKVVARYDSGVKPDDAKVTEEIEAQLKK